jgi:riboflavin synthase alpha subunit
MQQFSLRATALVTYITETSQLLRTEVSVKTRYGGQLISGLVDCVATLDFV